MENDMICVRETVPRLCSDPDAIILLQNVRYRMIRPLLIKYGCDLNVFGNYYNYSNSINS